MTSRQIRSVYEGRSVQAPGAIRRGPLEPLPPPELLESKIASQSAEIERLARDNNRLAATHVALREDLVDTRHESQKLKEHIKSIKNESDIQIRVLQEKIAKMQSDIQVGERVKKELQHAHIEAQNLVKARQELMAQLQQASQELMKTHADVKSLPELHSELEGLKKEHQRLRVTFQYEKGSNMEQVEEMKAMEKNLIEMAREVETLRAEILSADKKVHAPTGSVPYGGYTNADTSYLPPFQSGGAYFDGYSRPVMLGPAEGMVPYSSSANVPVATAATGNQAVPVRVWGAPYYPSLGPR